MILLYSTIIIINLILIKFHKKLNLFGVPYDMPDNTRKFHKDNVLISGGLIFLFNVLILFIYLNFIDYFFLKKLFSNNQSFYSYIILLLAFFLLGFYDDKKNLNPNKKLLILSLLYFMLIYSNDIFLLKSIKLSFYNNEFFLHSFSLPFTILCLLLFTNATNMYDGINLQSVSYYICLILFLLINNIFFKLFLFLLIPILTFGFLNFKNKSFLGDGGCYLVSFLFGSIFIASYNLNLIMFADTIFLLMILPGFDMLRLFALRAIKNKSPFKADREHIHHKMLLSFGYKKTIIILAFFQFIITTFLLINLNYFIILLIILFFYFFILFYARKNVRI